MMKKKEIFTLVAGILGFVVDAIALATFLVRVSQASPSQKVSSFPLTWGILLLVYGWFVVSWVLAQWKLTRRASSSALSAKTDKTPAASIIAAAVMVVGFLLLPLAFMIVSDFLRNFQGPTPLDLERLLDIILYSLLSMSMTGVAIFAAIYGLLGIIVDGEEIPL